MSNRRMVVVRTLSALFAVVLTAVCAAPVGAQFNQWAYGRTPDEIARRISEVPAGGTISCGEVVITRQDAAANVLWMLEIESFHPHVAIPTADGGFAVAGPYIVDNEIKTMLVKLSGAGVPDWHHFYPGTHLYENCDLIQSFDGGFVIALEYDPPEDLFRLPFLIKTKPNGFPEWMHRYFPIGYDSPAGEFSFVEEDVDADAVSTFNLAGTIGEFPLGKSDTLLMRVASDGSVVNAHSIGFEDHHDFARGLTRVDDHGFLVTGYSKEFGEGGGTYLMRVFDNFTLDWYAGVYGFSGTKEIHLTSLNQALLGGTTTFPNPVQNAALISIDLATISLGWGMQYGGPNDSDGCASFAPNPNGYDVFGTTRSYDINPNQDFYLVKTDPFGQSGCNEEIYEPQIIPALPPEKAEKFKVNVYEKVSQHEIEWSFVDPFERRLCDEPPDPCECIEPPEEMVGWWTLDELVGPIAADSVSGNDGSYVGNPIPTAGKVDNCLDFDGIDDYVLVPDDPLLNLTVPENLTIDAWIFIDDPDPMEWGPIMSKIEPNGISTGYALSVRNDRLELYLSGIIQSGTYTGSIPVPHGQWVHVAGTADFYSTATYGVTLYVNGVPESITWPALPFSGINPSTDARIGSLEFEPGDPASPPRFFDGKLDEVEFFDRALDASEIQAIYNADECGKCKLGCHVPWDEPFCVNDLKIDVIVTVCNNSPVDATVDVAFGPINPPMCGNVAGPTGFTIVAPGNPVLVPGNSCVDVTVSIDKPIDMVNSGDLGCYEVTFTNLDTGQSTTCTGTVIYHPELCSDSDDPTDGGFVDLIPEIDTTISIDIVNTGLDAGFFEWRAVAYGENMEFSDNIGVNGSEPGQYAAGEVVIPLGESVELQFNLLAREFAGLEQSDFVLLMLSGNTGVPLISVPLRTVPSDEPCIGDLNGDGSVDGADLATLLGSWGDCGGCAADLNGDGIVDGADLATILGAWGPC